jgi:hypothetical protein
MSERVRIYELARKMNMPAQGLIDACRELGYDVKSHSSTIDGHVVGLVIAHLGKKKQPAEKAEPKAVAASTGTTTKPATAAPAKASSKAAPPPPPVVKPRVLARYRREPVVDPAAEPVAEVAPVAPPAPVEEAPAPPAPVQLEAPEPVAMPAPPVMPTHVAEPELPQPTPTPAVAAPSAQPPRIL